MLARSKKADDWQGGGSQEEQLGMGALADGDASCMRLASLSLFISLCGYIRLTCSLVPVVFFWRGPRLLDTARRDRGGPMIKAIPPSLRSRPPPPKTGRVPRVDEPAVPAAAAPGPATEIMYVLCVLYNLMTLLWRLIVNTTGMSFPRPSSYPLLGPKYLLLGTIYPQLRVQGRSCLSLS